MPAGTVICIILIKVERNLFIATFDHFANPIARIVRSLKPSHYAMLSHVKWDTDSVKKALQN